MGWRGMIGGVAWWLASTSWVGAAVPQWQFQDDAVIPADPVNGLRVEELSGLAWDSDEQLLYAVSDRGVVFHFRVDGLPEGRLRSVQPVYAAVLLDDKGNALKKGRRDAEGLAVLNASNGKRGDTQLVISLEGQPRIVRFTSSGRAIKNIALPKAVEQLPKNNSGLESVALHPRYAFLTAKEHPARGEPENLHTLYSTQGQRWQFLAYPAPKSSITALETLPDGSLLVLERAWSGFPNPLVISLRHLDFRQCSKEKFCRVQDVQVFSSHLLVDNFEGLTHVQGKQYLMVSDDGGGDWQRTVLRLFTLE